MRRSIQISLIATFSALHAVLYFSSFGLPWRNWGVYLETLEGIILGPYVGFFSALLGSSIARFIMPDVFLMFGIVAEPLSVLTAGLLARGKWKPVLAVFMFMVAAYFAHAYGRMLPLWTILDILLTPFLIYPSAKLNRKWLKAGVKHVWAPLILTSFVCIVTDSLVRVFMLVPAGLHSLFFTGFEDLEGAFVVSAGYSFIEDAVAPIVSLVVGVPLLMAIAKLNVPERVNNAT
jgi:hypothetical protein